MSDKKKVYLYTRVSTIMQVDGYSLEAQKSRMRMFAEFSDYEIVGEYEDAGKSGKSIEGRPAFTQMINDIKDGKDNVEERENHKVHFFYWRLKEPILKKGDCIVISEMNDWSVNSCK